MNHKIKTDSYAFFHVNQAFIKHLFIDLSQKPEKLLEYVKGKSFIRRIVFQNNSI